MRKENSFNRQFRGDYFPQQHWDESTRVNGPEVSSPTAIRKRQGVALGSQTQTNPGLVGKQDYKRKKVK